MNMGDKLISSKLSAELASIVRDKLELGSEERVNVRVILEEDAIIKKVAITLEGKGFKIKNIQEVHMWLLQAYLLYRIVLQLTVFPR